jgi:hypothetical protein
MDHPATPEVTATTAAQILTQRMNVVRSPPTNAAAIAATAMLDTAWMLRAIRARGHAATLTAVISWPADSRNAATAQTTSPTNGE